jgi:NAD(P)H-hydrate repair Nnr-like enzyme with NAD(P)H-hydrate dehydratase domain
MSAFDAACAGVYVHGAAADALVARGTGPMGLTASEVAIEVRATINALNRGQQ